MRSLSVALLALSIASCSQPLDPQSASIAGIVSVAPAADHRTGFLLTGMAVRHVPAVTEVQDFRVGIGGPVYQQRENGELVLTLPSALTQGAPVRVWTDGEERRSLPVQVTAIRIVIEYRNPNSTCRAVGHRPNFEQTGRQLSLSC